MPRLPRPLLVLLAGLALVGLVVACGDDGGGDAPEVTAEVLDGTSWVSTNVAGYDLVEDTQVTLSFDRDQLGMSGGCNQLSSGYEVADSRLTLTGEVASTMMACDEALEAQDQWLASLFEDGADLTLAGGLIVVVDEVEIELVEQA